MTRYFTDAQCFGSDLDVVHAHTRSASNLALSDEQKTHQKMVLPFVLTRSVVSCL